ncbi:MAG: type II and III secretion system protein family protein [Xanthobacteraceae bacterium]
MTNAISIRTAGLRTSLGALLALAFSTAGHSQAVQPKIDASTPTIQIAASEATSRFVPLGIGKSIVIDLPRDVKDVLVADPKTANAVIRTSRRAYIIGVAVGQTSVVFFDADGRQIAGLDVAVTRDLNGVRAALQRLFPNGDIRIDGVGEGVLLTGSVQSPSESQQAFDIAARLVGETAKVVNGITIRGRDQVLLKVTVAEVQRDVIKQLGVDLAGRVGGGATVLNFATTNPFGAVGSALSATNAALTYQSTTAVLRAMERAGVIRTLAEPNLTAISGETATFLAGGEFPIPAGLSCDTSKVPPICQQSIEYKKFGVSLNFTPVVLADGRISLKVMTEASDLSNENAITLQVPGSNQTLTIPSIRVRRADTTLEIPSGGSLAMAGMIQEQTKAQINGVPGLMQLPVLGTLFRSRDYLNRQSELMVIVTPYVVHAVAQKDLAKPDDGYADVSDPSTVLLGRLNRIYGITGSVDPNKLYRGSYGFIMD